MAITIQKSSSGLTFTVQEAGGPLKEYPSNGYRAVWYPDGISFSIINKNDSSDAIIPINPYTNIINGDTSSAFASLSDLQTYVRANFFV